MNKNATCSRLTNLTIAPSHPQLPMNASTSFPQSRRQFIRTTSALLALPWLETFAVAGETAPPRRMVNVCTSFGLYGPSFFPQKAGRDYEPGDYLKVLADVRDKFTVFSGISHPDIGGDHASEVCFLTSAKRPRSSNFRNSISLDVVAAKHVGNATRFPLLALSTMEGGALTHTTTGAPIPAIYKPSEVFARLFLAGKATDVKKEMERLKRGQSVLDSMGSSFASLKNTLGNRDRQQIADYADAVRDMERQLQANEAWAVRPKPVVDEKPPEDPDSRRDIVGCSRLMFNLTRLALQTDSTRVVSIFIKGLEGPPLIEGVIEAHHTLTHHAHNAGKLAQLQIIERAEMAVFRDFLVSLRDTKEGAGSLLDSTQILLGSNLGDASGHGTSNLPILLAGGGYKHGQHIAGDTKNNTPLAKLFVNMLQRFGVETNMFGSGTGTIDGLV